MSSACWKSFAEPDNFVTDFLPDKMRTTYAFGDFREAGGLLTRKGKQVHLTPKEAAVLRVLLENAGSVVMKEEFHKKCWPEIRQEIEVDNCLKRAISTLRKRLGGPKSRSQYIHTLSQRGYLFIAKVTIMPEAPSGRLKIAVLPFRNLARGKHPTGFIDGFTEDVTNQIGRLNPQRLSVTPRSTIRRYKTAKKTIAKIGEELGVGYVLEGGVLRSGNKLCVTVQLSLVTDESQLWGETYERDLEDILVFLRVLSQDVARILQIELVSHGQARLDDVAPVKPEAYESYLEGRQLFNKRTPESLQEAMVLFENAIALDPSFALAHSALSECLAVIASQSSLSPKQACARAKLAATTAVRLDPTLAEPHAALGFILLFERDWAKAEHEFQQALKFNDNCAVAHHWYSFYLAAQKRLTQAIQQIRIAQKIEPHSPMINTNVGTMLYWDGAYDAAIERYDKALRLDSDFWYAYWMRGLAHDEKGHYRQAAADQRRALRHCPDQSPLLAASLARSLALAPRRHHKAARRQLKEAKEGASRSALPHYHFAVAHAALGERDAAFRSLLESCSAHEMWICFVRVDPKIGFLRNDNRYAELLRRLSLS